MFCSFRRFDRRENSVVNFTENPTSSVHRNKREQRDRWINKTDCTKKLNRTRRRDRQEREKTRSQMKMIEIVL